MSCRLIELLASRLRRAVLIGKVCLARQWSRFSDRDTTASRSGCPLQGKRPKIRRAKRKEKSATCPVLDSGRKLLRLHHRPVLGNVDHCCCLCGWEEERFLRQGGREEGNIRGKKGSKQGQIYLSNPDIRITCMSIWSICSLNHQTLFTCGTVSRCYPPPRRRCQHTWDNRTPHADHTSP